MSQSRTKKVQTLQNDGLMHYAQFLSGWGVCRMPEMAPTLLPLSPARAATSWERLFRMRQSFGGRLKSSNLPHLFWHRALRRDCLKLRINNWK